MKNITQSLKIITLALVLSFGISYVYVYAWTAPTQTPPNGNVSTPINTSATGQYKAGGLGIGGLIRGYGNAIFDGNVGIGTDPGAKLEVAGQMKITGGSPGANKVLTSDATGLASWTTPASAPVTSVFGRTGEVSQVSGDYSVSQVTGAAPTASPTFTGTVSGITASMVGLGNVTNESKSTMFASPTFTGTINATTGIFSGEITATTFLYSSDRNLKKNITPLSGQLEKISQLQGVSFDWKKDDKHSLGLIAQDVERMYPDLVSTDKATGLKAVEYGNLVAPLIEAVKEQQVQIDLLKKEIEKLKNK